MKMNKTNFVSISKEVVIDLSLLLFCYQKIKFDNASTRKEIELLDGEFGEILDKMYGVIEFAGQARQTVDMVSDSLNSGLKLTSQIMQEKTRIVKTCATLAHPCSISYHISLN